MRWIIALTLRHWQDRTQKKNPSNHDKLLGPLHPGLGGGLLTNTLSSHIPLLSALSSSVLHADASQWLDLTHWGVLRKRARQIDILLIYLFIYFRPIYFSPDYFHKPTAIPHYYKSYWFAAHEVLPSFLVDPFLRRPYRSLAGSMWTAFMDLECTGLSGRWRVFVFVSSSYNFRFRLRLLSA